MTCFNCTLKVDDSWLFRCRHFDNVQVIMRIEISVVKALDTTMHKLIYYGVFIRDHHVYHSTNFGHQAHKKIAILGVA